MTCQSWDYRAKQGFYVGPALDHYRCYELVKSETKQKIISNMVKFRHAYLQIPVVLVDDKIINGLQVIAGALWNAPPLSSSNQLDAIEMLHRLFEKLILLAPPALQTDSCPVRAPHVSQAPMPSRVPQLQISPTTHFMPWKKMMTRTHRATTWSPPPLPASMPRTPAQCARVAPF
jgi:hypothetical protein